MGNIDSQRDWGHAQDYVEGMWRVLQNDKPDDFVLATGKMYSVRKFIETAFSLNGIQIAWKGEGVNEIGYDTNTGREYIFIDAKYFRPAEVELLIGDSTKARTVLGWQPQIEFEELVERMVRADCP
jgi:GDPmannose 4,6-dehydratase